MASKELIEKVAIKISVGFDEDVSSKEIAMDVLSIVIDALLEQFDELNVDPFIPQGVKIYVHRFLNASPLGEQSE